MENNLEKIARELRRVGCPLNVSEAPGSPALCQVDNSGDLSGQYQQVRLLNALSQLRVPDVGENNCNDVFAILAQIGFDQRDR